MKSKLLFSFYALFLAISMAPLQATEQNILIVQSQVSNTEKLTFPKHFDQYNDPKLISEGQEILFTGITAHQLNEYQSYMNTEEFQNRVSQDIVVPISSSDPDLNSSLFEELSQEDIEKFLETKQLYLNRLAKFFLKVSFNKVPRDIANRFISQFNDEFYQKAREVIGDRTIAVDINGYSSIGLGLPRSVSEPIRRLIPFVGNEGSLGFYLVLGWGGTFSRTTINGETKKSLRPTVNLRYSFDTENLFGNFDLLVANANFTIESPENRVIKISDHTMFSPMIEIIHNGDQLGINAKQKIFFLPLVSSLMVTSGKAIQIDVSRITFADLINSSKFLSQKITQQVKKQTRKLCNKIF